MSTSQATSPTRSSIATIFRAGSANQYATYTYAPFSYEIYTLVNGYDSCAGSGFVYQAGGANSDFNGTYGTSLPWQGDQQDCAFNHVFQVTEISIRWQASTADPEFDGGVLYY